MLDLTPNNNSMDGMAENETFQMDPQLLTVDTINL